MKNINYDLVKLLRAAQDTVWRIERHYLKDAEDAKCHSVPALKKILEDAKEHVSLLREEIAMRAKAGVFD